MVEEQHRGAARLPCYRTPEVDVAADHYAVILIAGKGSGHVVDDDEHWRDVGDRRFQRLEQRRCLHHPCPIRYRKSGAGNLLGKPKVQVLERGGIKSITPAVQPDAPAQLTLGLLRAK